MKQKAEILKLEEAEGSENKKGIKEICTYIKENNKMQ